MNLFKQLILSSRRFFKASLKWRSCSSNVNKEKSINSYLAIAIPYKRPIWAKGNYLHFKIRQYTTNFFERKNIQYFPR